MQLEIEKFQKLAETCKEIINAPEENLSNLRVYVGSSDEVAMLSCLKVFLNILPAYKIDITQDRVKTKKKHLPLHRFEKTVYELYKAYVNNVCRDNSKTSFLIAIELLTAFDHFNFAEKLLNKVLKGTKQGVGARAVDVIVAKVRADTTGHLTFKVLVELLSFEYCDALYACITDLAIIAKIESTHEAGPPQESNAGNKESIALMSSRNDSSPAKAPQGNQKRASRKSRKLNFELQKVRQACGIEESKESLEADKKMYRAIVDNLMRIFFIILREKKTNLYIYALIGLQKYKKLIRLEFIDGLIQMLDESMLLSDLKIRLYAASCYLGLFNDKNLEFKSVVNCIFSILNPLCADFQDYDIQILKNILENLFIVRKQSNLTVHCFVHKLILFLSLQYSQMIFHITKDIIHKYEIDLYDADLHWPRQIIEFNNCHDSQNYPPYFHFQIFSEYLKTNFK